MEVSNIPFVVHDADLMDPVEKPILIELIKYYDSVKNQKRQAFVSFRFYEFYAEEIRPTIEKCKVIQLEANGQEIFGWAYTMENVFFVPEEARWSSISATAHKPEIGTVIDNAMRAIENENKTLKNVLPKNYESPDLDKRVLGDVVDIFTNNIDMSNVEESVDLLGRTYEYCIAQFAAYEGVKGGEFYTPASVVKTLVEHKVVDYSFRSEQSLSMVAEDTTPYGKKK